MKYAYISTQEPCSLGVRIVQVQDSKDGLIDVDGVLFWVDCDDAVNSSDYYYDMNDNQIKAIGSQSQTP
jgi:hypothetical protein